MRNAFEAMYFSLFIALIICHLQQNYENMRNEKQKYALV